MMRLVRDYASVEKLKKERRSVEETKFCLRDLREFRRVFRRFDTDHSRDIGLEELQQMLAVIVGGAATGHWGTKELEDVLAACDEDAGGSLDFPEFLRVMRQLVDRNWRGINEKSSAMAS